MATSKLADLLGTNSIDGLAIYELTRMFRTWREKQEERRGLHGSAISASDSEFCYREHVLAENYRKNEVPITDGQLRIFLHGVYVHMKWQFLFRISGVAEHIERQSLSKTWGVTLTPDAIIHLLKKRWVVEIKTMNQWDYAKLKDSPPINAVRQAQFYMHCTGIPRGIILVEGKDPGHTYKLWTIDYDPKMARPFVVRLHNIKAYMRRFKKEGKLPKRIEACTKPNDKRAKNCPLAEACFAKKSARLGMAL